MKSSKIIAVIVGLIALIWIGSGFITGAPPTPEQKKQAEPAAEKPLPEVRVRALKAELFSDDVVVTGRTQASRSIVLRSETESQVREILKEEGEHVNKGEMLAKLDIRDRAARLSEARERVHQREIQYNAAKELEAKGYNSKIKLAQAQADLEDARTALKQAQIERTRTTITAPFEGVINGQDIEVGDFLSVGDEMFTLVDLDPIELTGYVSERRVQDLTEGAPVFAEFLNGGVVEGTLSYIASAADPQTRTFRIQISAPNEQGIIKDGLTAKIRIPLEQKPAHKISPSILTLDDTGRLGVKIIGPGDVVEFVPVNVLADRTEAMYVTGLPESATVITVGQEFVGAGMKVKPVPATGEGLL